MKIQEMLSTLTTKEVEVTLIDAETEEDIVTLKAGGYASLEDSIEDRTVKKWRIVSANSIRVMLNASEPETTP